MDFCHQNLPHFLPDDLKRRIVGTVERGILDRCRAERERCPSRPALQFLTVIDQAQLQTGRARIGYINRAINLAIRPMGNFNNYVVSEKWKAPLATLATPAIVLTMLLS